MSQSNPIRLFVTHLWEDTDDYVQLFEYLENAKNFYYSNTSVIDNPPAGGGNRVREELLRQISEAEVIIVLPSLYDAQPELTLFQISCAQARKIPVLMMKYYGTHRALPKALTDRAADVVDWQERGLVDAIRLLARGENTARFDVVEFNPDEFKDFRSR